MPGSSKALVVCTLAALVLVTAYTEAFGHDSRLWFCWGALTMITLAAAIGRSR